MDMEREVRDEPNLRRLAVDTCVKWRSLLCHKRMRGVCDTNNVTGRVIGRSKILADRLRSRGENRLRFGIQHDCPDDRR